MNNDRLYNLLPAIYQIRDVENGGPLKELLKVISEQVNLVEADIDRLYENWFIETCEDWVVPYIAELVGYRPLQEAGKLGDVRTDAGRIRNKALIPRREVANTIRYRRQKGTLALLELLANDVAGWPARAVEYFKLLGWTQAVNFPHLDRARTVDVRNGSALDHLGGPFDPVARSVDVRRINSRFSVGRHNIPSVGVFLWRLKSYLVPQTSAFGGESKGTHRFTFSVLGNDAPLFVKASPESDPAAIAEELNLPVPVRRRLLAESLDALYGENKSFYIWTGVRKGNKVEKVPVPRHQIVPANLSKWQYLPAPGTVAVDPLLGRIAFPPGAAPKHGVWVRYHHGFSADIGGGVYRRALSQQTPFTLYQVGEGAAFDTIDKALNVWRDDKPAHAVVEIVDSRDYTEPINVEFDDGHQSLQLRAGVNARPVIRLLDRRASQSDAFTVVGRSGERFTLDGILVAGRGVQVSGELKQLTIRHTTLVPGWAVDHDCEPREPTEPSLEVESPNVCVVIEHSIVGSIQINPILMPPNAQELGKEWEIPEAKEARCGGLGPGYRLDPIRVCIRDSIIDATGTDLEAIGAPGCPVAHAILNIARTTVFGQVQVHAIELGENSIFEGKITVARRQIGCLRFSWVEPGSRAPARHACQPDLAQATVGKDPAMRAAAVLRVRPQFSSRRYGRPDYAQLGSHCADDIRRGADDESEMGVFHDLFQPQRLANLRARLDEYVPSSADVGIVVVS